MYYLGPFAAFPFRTVQVPERYYGCPTVSCHRYGRRCWPHGPEQFCSYCGARLAENQRMAGRMQPDANELVDRVRERLHWGEIKGDPRHYWLSNITRPEARDFRAPGHKDGLLVATPELLAAELADFARFYAAELEILQQAYDAPPNLAWGAITLGE